MFRVGKPPFEPLIRNISLANRFSVPLVLYDIRLSSKAQEYFTVSRGIPVLCIILLHTYTCSFQIILLHTRSNYNRYVYMGVFVNGS